MATYRFKPSDYASGFFGIKLPSFANGNSVRGAVKAVIGEVVDRYKINYPDPAKELRIAGVNKEVKLVLPQNPDRPGITNTMVIGTIQLMRS